MLKRRLSPKFMKKIDGAGGRLIVGKITYEKHPGRGAVAYRAVGMQRHPEDGIAIKRIYRKDGTRVTEND